MPLALAAALLLLGALPTFANHAAAQPGVPPRELVVQAHDEGPPDSHADRDFWFTVQGMEGRNPALVLQPGTTYRVALLNHGSVEHNLQFSGLRATTPLVPPGGNRTLEVVVPSDAQGLNPAVYQCVPHAVMGMRAPLGYGEEVAPREVGIVVAEKHYLPGAPAVLGLGLAGLAALAMGRRAGE